MSLEQDVTNLMEADIFKPASQVELSKRMEQKDTYTGEELHNLWGSGKVITFKGQKYTVNKMSYGDYFLEPVGWKGGERDGFAPGTLWFKYMGDADFQIDEAQDVFKPASAREFAKRQVEAEKNYAYQVRASIGDDDRMIDDWFDTKKEAIARAEQVVKEGGYSSVWIESYNKLDDDEASETVWAKYAATIHNASKFRPKIDKESEEYYQAVEALKVSLLISEAIARRYVWEYTLHTITNDEATEILNNIFRKELWESNELRA